MKIDDHMAALKTPSIEACFAKATLATALLTECGVILAGKANVDPV